MGKGKFLHRLPPGYVRVRQPGETVTDGDYLQIGRAFSLVDGSLWVGHKIEAGGAFETVWTKDLASNARSLAEELRDQFGNFGEHPDYPVEDWRCASFRGLKNIWLSQRLSCQNSP